MSIVDKLLAQYGFGWETAPYRIVDLKTGKTVLEGKSFDLTEDSLRSLKKTWDVRQLRLFKRPQSDAGDTGTP
jgi:hypothetical protein